MTYEKIFSSTQLNKAYLLTNSEVPPEKFQGQVVDTIDVHVDKVDCHKVDKIFDDLDERGIKIMSFADCKLKASYLNGLIGKENNHFYIHTVETTQ